MWNENQAIVNAKTMLTTIFGIKDEIVIERGDILKSHSK